MLAVRNDNGGYASAQKVVICDENTRTGTGDTDQLHNKRMQGRKGQVWAIGVEGV